MDPWKGFGDLPVPGNHALRTTNLDNQNLENDLYYAIIC